MVSPSGWPVVRTGKNSRTARGSFAAPIVVCPTQAHERHDCANFATEATLLPAGPKSWRRAASGLILTFASRYPDSPAANVKILKSTRIIKLLVVQEILTFAHHLAESGCKCQNRTTSPSRWRLMKIALATVRAAIRGPLLWQTVCKAYSRIRRHLAEPPRRRRKQCDYITAGLT